MSIASERKLIREAFEECRHVYSSYVRGWNDLLLAALEAGKAGERQHRRNRSDRWLMSVDDCARFFAVKWFLEIHKRPKSWAEVCSVRDEARLAKGAADSCPKEQLYKLRLRFRAIETLDYSKWVSR